MKTDDLCVLTRVIDASDPLWDKRAVLIDTRDGLREKFPAGIPHGWQLLRGARARRYLKKAVRLERLYQRDQQARRAAKNNN